MREKRENQKKVIVKIDLCDSKHFFDSNKSISSDKRKETNQKLAEVIKNNFPKSDKSYPEGTLYSGQGDCIHIILDNVDVAIRGTIEFMKNWSSLIPSYPDCRAVIDFGTVSEDDSFGRIELLGEALENISVIEKATRSGEITVTELVKIQADSSSFQFVQKREEHINETRKITCWQVNYHNPRLIEDSALVHALFVAQEGCSEIRYRAFEAMIIDYVVNHVCDHCHLESFNKYLSDLGISEIDNTLFFSIAHNSAYLDINENDNSVFLVEEKREKIDEIRKKYEADKFSAIDTVKGIFSTKLELPKAAIADKIDIPGLLEEYFSAIFLEVRIMAAYFSSTKTLFEKLSEVDEFDYIIKKYFNFLIKDQTEAFTYIKKIFLSSISPLIETKNTHIATIFHNVLLLYYLNRNRKYALDIKNKIMKIKLYLDTNVLYAIRCKGSAFHQQSWYIIKKLSSLGTKILVYDKSVEELNESLESALLNYHKRFTHYDSTWIRQEYDCNASKYANSFSFCVRCHKIPNDYQKRNGLNVSGAKNVLDQFNIKMVKMDNFLEEKELGRIFPDVFEAKKKYNRTTGKRETPNNYDIYFKKVLHDANCLKNLKCYGNNPLDCENIFLTLDFNLARIRKNVPGEYMFLVTLSEFYEFILPYLFIDDTNNDIPIDLPNFLLASSISMSLNNLDNIDNRVGKILATVDDDHRDWEGLLKIKNDERFNNIYEKNAKLPRDEKLNESMIEELAKDVKYICDGLSATALSLIKFRFVENTISQLKNEANHYKEKAREAEEFSNMYEAKEKKRKEYIRKQKKRKLKKG